MDNTKDITQTQDQPNNLDSEFSQQDSEDAQQVQEAINDDKEINFKNLREKLLKEQSTTQAVIKENEELKKQLKLKQERQPVNKESIPYDQNVNEDFIKGVINTHMSEVRKTYQNVATQMEQQQLDKVQKTLKDIGASETEITALLSKNPDLINDPTKLVGVYVSENSANIKDFHINQSKEMPVGNPTKGVQVVPKEQPTIMSKEKEEHYYKSHMNHLDIG